MGLSPLHRLVEMIKHGEVIDDSELLDTLGPDELIAVPLRGGGERHLPSGEILAVLIEAAGVSADKALATSFRLSHDEIVTARDFIRLVQFSGGSSETGPEGSREEPIQPLDT